ncbi:MAG: hypothetical protein ACE5F9_07925, partial [Phycisphaerae bacterium]
MNQLACLLAQAGRSTSLKGLRQAFPREGRDSQEMLKSLAVVAVAFAIAIFLIWCARYFHGGVRRSPVTKAFRLFSQCLSQLGVGYTDRLLLRMAARQCELEQPTVMLFSPTLMDRFAGRWAELLPVEALRPWATRRIRGVSAKLF